jgi:preprotein translocase subunit SecA
VDIPTNVPMVRDDSVDQIYSDQKAKYNAVMDAIEERHQDGQPVLVGTTDIAKSEVLSERLKKRGIPHQVLNAKQHEREAAIVAEAGRPGAVTVATNMAGRGTDIVLGGNPDSIDISREHWEEEHRKVVDAGGLHIIGTERHEARRIDNQLRGRSGRQGDSGSTRFYVALDDGLMRRFGGDKIQAVMNWAGMDETAPLENKMISRSIEGAQVKVEAFHFDTRKQLVEYDDVINTHRTVIYGERNKVLSGADLKSNIQEMIETELPVVVSRHLEGIPPEDWDVDELLKELLSILPLAGDLDDPDVVAEMDQDEILEQVLAQAGAVYEEREADLGPEVMRIAEREVMLRTIDANWVPHLTAMENLRQGIGLHAYGQRDPLVMYKREGMEMFETLKERIQYDIVHTIYHVGVGPATTNGRQGRTKKGSQGKNVMAKAMGGSPRAHETAGAIKVGRNEACPCGSGKKYKRCHGA